MPLVDTNPQTTGEHQGQAEPRGIDIANGWWARQPENLVGLGDGQTHRILDHARQPSSGMVYMKGVRYAKTIGIKTSSTSRIIVE